MSYFVEQSVLSILGNSGYRPRVTAGLEALFNAASRVDYDQLRYENRTMQVSSN